MSMSFLSDLSYFNEEEKIILNHLAVDNGKDVCCEQLSMCLSISDDSDIVSILESTYSKIKDLSSEDWADLQSVLPYDVSISDDDFAFSDIEDMIDSEV